jgi:hypothetical protein
LFETDWTKKYGWGKDISQQFLAIRVKARQEL